MYGIIDIGSNTIRLSLYEVQKNGEIKAMLRKKSFASLASYVTEEKMLSSHGIKKAVAVLKEFKAILSSINNPQTSVFATASLRNINNAQAVVTVIKEETGLDVRIISGEEEGIFDFIGATHCVSVSDGLLVDIGGGSTELVFYEKKKIIKAISIPIGSLNMYNKYISEIIPSPSEVSKIEQCTEKTLYKCRLNLKPIKMICGVGGTIRATGKVYNNINDLPDSNRIISAQDVKTILKMTNQNKKNASTKILQIVPERIHTIYPGLAILKTIIKIFSCETIEISNCGVREGFLLSEVLGTPDAKSHIIN